MPPRLTSTPKTTSAVAASSLGSTREFATRTVMVEISGPTDISLVEPDSAGETVEPQHIAELGRDWVARHADLLATTPPNTIIAINVETGEYVSATDGVEVMDLFEARFPGAWAWVHHNNGPIRVGGWL